MLLGFMTIPLLALGAPAAMPGHPNTAYALASRYLAAHAGAAAATTEELAKQKDFETFLGDQGIKPGGKMAGIVASLVASMIAAAKDEDIEPDATKPAFQALVQEVAAQNLKVSIAALNDGSGTATSAQTGEGNKVTQNNPAKKEESTAQPATGAAKAGDAPATKEDLTAVQTRITEILDKDTTADFTKIQAYFHTGVTLLNPYHIDITKTPLTVAPATSTDMNAFLEFVYNNRWAWNEERQNNVFKAKDIEGDSAFKSIFDGVDVLSELDVQGRVGYTFASGGSPTANTLVGSGNFNAMVSVEAPFVLYRSKNDTSAFSVGPEGSFAAVTERATLRAHPNWFWGLGYATSFIDPFNSKDKEGNIRRVLLHFRLGHARVDSVRYVSDAGKEIFSTNGSLPRYFPEWSQAFEAELMYPVKTSTYITFGSQIYPELNPGQWNVQIGVTTSLADLLNTFFK